MSNYNNRENNNTFGGKSSIGDRIKMNQNKNNNNNNNNSNY